MNQKGAGSRRPLHTASNGRRYPWGTLNGILSQGSGRSRSLVCQPVVTGL